MARLMRAGGIEGTRRGKRVKTTKSDPAADRHPDLVKCDFTAIAPNQLWATDIKCRVHHFLGRYPIARCLAIAYWPTEYHTTGLTSVRAGISGIRRWASWFGPQCKLTCPRGGWG